ncbi:hypothetical protein JCM16303_002331 [Sporobolomyces ruberrimus]
MDSKPSSLSFSQSELDQALSEVDPWGFTSSRIVQHPTKAIVDLVLLERNQVRIECTESGWRLLTCPEYEQSLIDSTTYDRSFETLDDLLLVVSPEFEKKRMEKLFEKLSRVDEERNGRFEYSDSEEGEHNDEAKEAEVKV